MKQKKKNFLTHSTIVILLFLVVYLKLEVMSLKRNMSGVIGREQGGEYIYTNPILDFEFSKISSEAIIPSGDIRRFVDYLKEKNNVDHVSVYFRDLNNGPWVGVNEKEYFTPASMLKTPLIIALYKWSETEASVLEKQVVAEERFFLGVPDQVASSSITIKRNATYTLSELAQEMIQNSDNVATNILYNHIPKAFIDNTFLNIGVPLIDKGDEVLLRVKDIASFYRILFNASYLNRENSELVLKILSGTSYKKGLVAGVPENVVVAHKFGERFPANFLAIDADVQDQTLQLHDCGIVYYPKKPYILCIMTRGDNFEKQQEIIVQISKFFYEKINKRE